MGSGKGVKRAGVIFIVIALLLLPSLIGAYALKNEKWWRSDYPIEWRMNVTDDVPTIPGPLEFDEIRRAFNVWEDDPGSYIEFQEGPNSLVGGFVQDGDSVMSFEDPLNELDHPTLAATQTWSESGVDSTCPLVVTSHIIESDIVFNDNVDYRTNQFMIDNFCDPIDYWGDPDYDTWIDIQGVAVHELGHFLGLGHSAFEQSTMFWAVNYCDTSKNTLHWDDKAGIAELYCNPETNVTISSLRMDPNVDPLCNDGDDYLDGGETAILFIALFATGEVATDTEAILTSLEPAVEVLRSTWDYGTIPMGGVRSRPFDIRVDPGVGCGKRALFELEISASGSFHNVESFSYPINVDHRMEHLGVVDDALEEGSLSHAPNPFLDRWVRVEERCGSPDENPAFWRVGGDPDCTSFYPNNHDGILVKRINVDQDVDSLVSLIITHKYRFADNGDYGRVMISPTADSFYLPVESIYGRSDGWTTDVIDLEPLEGPFGPDLDLLFQLVSDGEGSSEGWFIGEIKVQWSKESTQCDTTECFGCDEPSPVSPTLRVRKIPPDIELYWDGGGNPLFNVKKSYDPSFAPSQYLIKDLFWEEFREKNGAVNGFDQFYRIVPLNDCGDEGEDDL